MSDALRSSQSQTEDSRAIATRERLRSAFETAVAGGVTEITVIDLCRIAGVGRSTFYTHYATIEDLAVDTIGDLFRAVSPADVERRTSRILDRPTLTRVALTELVDTLWRSRRLALFTLTLTSGPVIQQRLIAQVARLCRPSIIAERPDLAEPELRLISNFIAGGSIQLILTWLDQPDVSREDVIDALLSLLPSWMTTSAD